MAIKDDLAAFDHDEREAFVRLHREHPEIPIEQLTKQIADEFRPRWMKIMAEINPPKNAANGEAGG